MNEQQKRVIRENPNLQSGVLARFLNLNKNTVKSHRTKNRSCGKWTYSGVGLPKMFFETVNGSFVVKYGSKWVFRGTFDKAVNVVDHLIWCIENGMFNQPRIEHPYFENLSFGE